tara:strand:- start:493 stop:1197 length:705 start_codon:yes stop_codon:yes gene_type:complete
MNKILITGASSEIGKDFLIQNNSKKNIFFAQYNTDKNFLKFVNSHKFKSKIKPIKCNFFNKNDTNTFLKKIKKIKFDKIIHIASKPTELIRFTELNEKNFIKEYKISFLSILKILQVCIPKMHERNKGQIIFVLSSTILDNKTIPYLAHYNCLKFQLLGLMRSLIKDYENTNIKFTGISPDMMDTKFLRKIDRRLLFLKKKKIKFLKVRRVVKKINEIIKYKDKFNGKNVPILI